MKEVGVSIGAKKSLSIYNIQLCRFNAKYCTKVFYFCIIVWETRDIAGILNCIVDG